MQIFQNLKLLTIPFRDTLYLYYLTVTSNYPVLVHCWTSLFNWYFSCRCVLNYLLLRGVSYIIYKSVLRAQSHHFCWSIKYFYCIYFWENVLFIWWIIFFKYEKSLRQEPKKKLMVAGFLSYFVASMCGIIQYWEVSRLLTSCNSFYE